MQPLLGEREEYGREGRVKPAAANIALVLTIISCTLFIVALATPQLIHTSGFGSIKTNRIKADFGPFRVCYDVLDSSDCVGIDSSCKFEVTVAEAGGAAITADVKVVDNCQKWNAARGMLVTAVVASVLSLLFEFGLSLSDFAPSTLSLGSGILNVLAAVSGLVSIALFADMRNKDDTFTSANSATFAYGFWLAVTASIFALIAAVPAIRSKVY